MTKTFKYHDATIEYTTTGTGTPIVLLHGFGEDASVWQSQLAALAQSNMVVVPSLPGTGASTLLQGQNISMTTYADCIKALIDTEGLEKIILLGHSMGGYITLAFAEKYPNSLSGFGLVHSTAFADTDDKKETRKKGIETINTYGAFPFLQKTTPNLFSDGFKQQNPQAVETFIAKSKNFTKEALTQYYAAMMSRPDRTAVLKASKVPVLFVVGSQDTAAPVNDLMQQVGLPTIAHVHILDGVGHISMIEKPDLLQNYLVDFVTMQSSNA